MRNKVSRKWVAAVVTAVVALTIALPGAAFAAGGSSNSNTMGASWNVPTTPTTNTVYKDGKLYKVITTWAMAWSTSGPDFLGINNSSFYGNGGNGNANVTNTTYGATSTLVGIWASDANENPNAFNWNTFYNLYASEQTAAGKAMAQSDLACTSASWDTTSGVYGPFKYRPEVIWLCNNLSASQTATYVAQIQRGEYLQGQTVETITVDEYNALSDDAKKAYTADNARNPSKYTKTTNSFTGAGDDTSAYYVQGDESYNPYVIQPINSSPFTFVDSGYELANYCDQIIANTASNTYSGDVNWKTMNLLPRSNRYAETPQECAMNIEALARGSVYYTLGKIADGTVAKKKVAYVMCEPGGTVAGANQGANTTLDSTHAGILVTDFTENIGGLGMNGVASWSPLAVDQLGADGTTGTVIEGFDHAVSGSGPTTGDNSQVEQPCFTYSYYSVTADDLAQCDVIYGGRSATMTPAQWRDFIKTNATTAEARAKADSIQVITGFPYVCNGSNYTMDKLIYGAFAMDVIYPELFPNMENSTFWYNKVYHIKNANLGSAMSWAFGVATLPSGTELPTTEEGQAYNASATIAKYDAGLKYFQAYKGSDETLVRVLSNTAFNGQTTNTTAANNYSNFEPSAQWIAAAANRTSETITPVADKAANPIKVTGKTVKAKTAKKTVIAKAKAFTITGAQGAVTFAKQSGNSKITIAKGGKITVKKGLKAGTYKLKVTATAAGNDKYEAGTANATVTIKVS